MADKYVPRMKAKYDAEVAAAMQAKFGYANHMEIPRIEKITLNMGVGEAGQEEGHNGCGRDGTHLGSEAGDHQGEEVDRAVQAA